MPGGAAEGFAGAGVDGDAFAVYGFKDCAGVIWRAISQGIDGSGCAKAWYSVHVVFDKGALPNVVLIPRSSMLGWWAATRMAKASSWPVSTSSHMGIFCDCD